MDTPIIHDATISVVSVGMGFILGFLTKSAMVRRIDSKQSETFVLVAVTVMWVISVAVDLLNADYQTSPLIHGLMGAIVGFYYKPKKGEHEGSTPKTLSP